jgi:hypothetical protein
VLMTQSWTPNIADRLCMREVCSLLRALLASNRVIRGTFWEVPDSPTAVHETVVGMDLLKQHDAFSPSAMTMPDRSDAACSLLNMSLTGLTVCSSSCFSINDFDIDPSQNGEQPAVASLQGEIISPWQWRIWNMVPPHPL